jgi:hypothetical protein
MDKRNVIHSRGGRVGGRADTKPEDVDAIVEPLRIDVDIDRHIISPDVTFGSNRKCRLSRKIFQHELYG